jgi:hypothetical protein
MAQILWLRTLPRDALTRSLPHRRNGRTTLEVSLLLLACLLIALLPAGCAPEIEPDAIDRAFAEMGENVPVESSGVVVKILRDDTHGSKHQRFIVRIPSGLTLLIAHNIDVGRRVPLNGTGGQISFRGEYEWNNKGGVVHWTHHDPRGRHPGGWIEYEGVRYD